MDIDELKLKADLAQDIHWQKIKEFTCSRFIELSKSNIDPVELKSLFKFIAIVDSWVEDYQKELKRLQQEQL